MQDPAAKRNLIIVLIIVGVLITALTLLFSGRGDNKPAETKPAETTAPETSSTKPTGKMQIDAGIRRYGQYGLTVEQLNAIKYGFFNFAKSKDQDVNVIEMDMDTFKTQRGDPAAEDPSSKVFVNFKMAGTTYRSKLTYYGLFRVHLYIYDESEKNLLYDSGEIDARNLPN